MSSNTNVLEAYQNDIQDSKSESKANPIELSTALIAYRQAYLQCIAKCWGDEDFAKDFISGPVDLNKTNSVWNNVLKNQKFLNFLQKIFLLPVFLYEYKLSTSLYHLKTFESNGFIH